MALVPHSEKSVGEQWSRELDDRSALISNAMSANDASCRGHFSIETTMANWEIGASWSERRSTVDWWNAAMEVDEISRDGYDLSSDAWRAEMLLVVTKKTRS